MMKIKKKKTRYKKKIMKNNMNKNKVIVSINLENVH